MEARIQVKLKALERDIKVLGSILRDAATTLKNENISNYPLFVAHQYRLSVGIPLIDRDIQNSNWSFNISTLEELVTKNIISNERVDPFREVYKDPEQFVSIFVIDEEVAEFIFYPYEAEIQGNAASDDE